MTNDLYDDLEVLDRRTEMKLTSDWDVRRHADSRQSRKRLDKLVKQDTTTCRRPLLPGNIQKLGNDSMELVNGEMIRLQSEERQ